MAEPFTVGVEEEYLLVDAQSLALRPRADQVHAATVDRGTDVEFELNLAQIEVATEVCTTLDEVRSELVRLRRGVIDGAAAVGTAVMASGTHPFSEWLGQQTTPKARYQRLADAYQQLAREQLICGCHVHVCIEDAELAVAVMTRIRPWLPVLLALSANSPYWQGIETGYDSYRAELFARWPLTGIPPAFADRADFDALVDELVRAEAIPDASFLYWDARPSTRFSTLELRTADVCQTVDEAVMIAALARSLVRVTVTAIEAGGPAARHHDQVLRTARWRAGRFGLDGDLFDPEPGRLRPADAVVDTLLARLHGDLVDHDEWTIVHDLVERVRRTGNGATRQRRASGEDGSRHAVAEHLVRSTDPRTSG